MALTLDATFGKPLMGGGTVRYLAKRPPRLGIGELNGFNPLTEQSRPC